MSSDEIASMDGFKELDCDFFFKKEVKIIRMCRTTKAHVGNRKKIILCISPMLFYIL